MKQIVFVSKMPLGQGWLNAWVKVNNKHVVYNRSDGEKQIPAVSTKPSRSSTTITSSKTMRTATSDDAETQAIRRVNSRKNKRRLHRTISASDLIRDQAKSLVGKPDGETKPGVAVPTAASAEHNTGSSSLAGLSLSVNSGNQWGDQNSSFRETEESLRFVSELFGADMDSFPCLEPSKLSGGIMDSGGVLLQWAPQVQSEEAPSLQSKGTISVPARPDTPPAPLSVHRTDQDESVSRSGFRFPPNLFSTDSSKGRCGLCTKLENELSALQDDLEYVRSVALRNDYICSSCNAGSSKHSMESTSPLHLKSNDKLLDEVTARHKAQLEQLTKDRVSTLHFNILISSFLFLRSNVSCDYFQQRWQHDAHVKLQKYAALCKDLNEEATLRNEEVISLHKELDSLRIERDQMAGELEIARAIIAGHERDATERKRLEAKILQYESRGLEEAEAAIRTRDIIIDDLSVRLAKALDVLETEREQQRQRRQIIFPTQRASHSCDQEDLTTELRDTKARLSEVQSELHSLQRLTENKEADLMSQIDALRRQLNAKI